MAGPIRVLSRVIKQIVMQSDAVRRIYAMETKRSEERNKVMAKTNKESSIQRPVLSVKETAAYLGVGETLIWTQIRAGNLKPLRLGDRVLFYRAYLDRLCEAR